MLWVSDLDYTVRQRLINMSENSTQTQTKQERAYYKIMVRIITAKNNIYFFFKLY